MNQLCGYESCIRHEPLPFSLVFFEGIALEDVKLCGSDGTVYHLRPRARRLWVICVCLVCILLRAYEDSDLWVWWVKVGRLCEVYLLVLRFDKVVCLASVYELAVYADACVGVWLSRRGGIRGQQRRREREAQRGEELGGRPHF